MKRTAGSGVQAASPRATLAPRGIARLGIEPRHVAPDRVLSIRSAGAVHHHPTSMSQAMPLRFEPAVAELALPDSELLADELAVSRCADPFEQWLRWEERANLVGFRMAIDPVALEVASIPAERVLVQRAA